MLIETIYFKTLPFKDKNITLHVTQATKFDVMSALDTGGSFLRDQKIVDLVQKDLNMLLKCNTGRPIISINDKIVVVELGGDLEDLLCDHNVEYFLVHVKEK